MRTAVTFLSLALLGASHVSAGTFEHQIPMRDKGAATYYVKGALEGFGAIDMMVDTGSSYTTINERTLASLQATGHATYVKELTGILADGTRKVVPVYRLTGLTIGDECTLSDVEAAVFPGSTRFLLGLSALRKAAPFVFSMEPPALVLSNCAKALQGTSGGQVVKNEVTSEAPKPAMFVPLPTPAQVAFGD